MKDVHPASFIQAVSGIYTIDGFTVNPDVHEHANTVADGFAGITVEFQDVLQATELQMKGGPNPDDDLTAGRVRLCLHIRDARFLSYALLSILNDNGDPIANKALKAINDKLDEMKNDNS